MSDEWEKHKKALAAIAGSTTFGPVALAIDAALARDEEQEHEIAVLQHRLDESDRQFAESKAGAAALRSSIGFVLDIADTNTKPSITNSLETALNASNAGRGLLERVRRLEEALKPFAAFGDQPVENNPVSFPVEYCRRAAKVLQR